eukprot:3742415-Rhodomonas_salina.2
MVAHWQSFRAHRFWELGGAQSIAPAATSSRLDANSFDGLQARLPSFPRSVVAPRRASAVIPLPDAPRIIAAQPDP